MARLKEPSVPPAPRNERQLERALSAAIAIRLPHTWAIEPSRLPEAGADATWELRAPDGTSLSVLVELEMSMNGGRVLAAQRNLRQSLQQRPAALTLVGAPYLSVPVRDELERMGLSYVDATGNMRVSNTNPALFLSDRGATADPWRGPGRPRGTLKGEPAARVVRSAVQSTPHSSWKTTDLLAHAGVSPGAGYRVLDFLTREGLAIRPSRGEVEFPDWQRLLRRWSEDYSFLGDNRTTRWIAPRGFEDVLERLSASTLRYAVTGSQAAAEWAPYAPIANLMIYVDDPDEAAAQWGLLKSDAGANVLLAEPPGEAPFLRSMSTVGKYLVVEPAQVAVDLLTAPGRGPSEAEALLSWMEKNEDSWRRA